METQTRTCECGRTFTFTRPIDTFHTHADGVEWGLTFGQWFAVEHITANPDAIEVEVISPNYRKVTS